MTVDAPEDVRVPFAPGPIGRVVRLVLGLALGQLVVSMIGLMADGFSGWPEDGDTGLFVAIGLTLWLGPLVYDVGLGRSLGHAWHVVAVAGAAVAAAGGAVAGAPATAAAHFVLVWMSVTLGWLAVSLVVAAVLRTPGCEMRAFRHAWARLTRRADRFVACPGPLQPLDEWEARTTGRAEPSPPDQREV